MGNLLSIKSGSFSMGYGLSSAAPLKGAADHFSLRIDDFLSIHVAGNKSGAFLLTVFVLKLGAANEQFTTRGAASAVQDGMADWRSMSIVQSDAGAAVIVARAVPRRIPGR
jgi:hypothetical protein